MSKMSELNYTICEQAERAGRAQWKTGVPKYNPYKQHTMEAKAWDKEFAACLKDLEWQCEQETNMV